MEVHHHPHVEKKRFKEYFLEFIMIFLAVVLGFIAENIREKVTEKHHAKEYSKLLVNDFNADLAELNRTEHILKRIIDCGDSLSNTIRSNDIKKIPAGKLYYYEYWCGWQWKVTTRDATLKQLESSGALRYLGDASLIKKILGYEETLKIISLLEDNINPQKNENWDIVQKTFDCSYFKTLQNIGAAKRDSSIQTSQTGLDSLDSFMNTNYQLLTYDKNIWMELSNRALTSSDAYTVLLGDVDMAGKKAKEAIAALEEEYHFN
jgi:hypothetical protein